MNDPRLSRSDQHAHIVCIEPRAPGRPPSPARVLSYASRCGVPVHAVPRVPSREQLYKLRQHGYQVITIADGPDISTPLALADEAVRVIAAHVGKAPLALTLQLPCALDDADWQRFDRAVGQVLLALVDWEVAEHSMVLLGTEAVPSPAQLSAIGRTLALQRSG